MMPRIFYYAYDHDIPRGGQRDTYRHVDILNANGYEAYVLHTANNYRISWFANKTPIIGMSDFRSMHRSTTDYTVLPEDLGDGISDFPGRKVIFNKGVYYGFNAFGLVTPLSYPYFSKDIVCAFSVSEHNGEYLRLAFPHLRIIQIRPGIDTSLFSYTSLELKQPQIVCVPKAASQFVTLYHILQARAEANLNRVRSCRWITLHGYSEAEVARILQASLMVIFLSIEEGYPRLLLEAMLSGCLIAGYRAGPIAECLPDSYQFDYGDLAGIVRYIEQVVAAFPNDLSRSNRETAKALARAREFSQEQEIITVMAAWKEVFEIAHSNHLNGKEGNQEAPYTREIRG